MSTAQTNSGIEELCQAIEASTAYWNAHRHPFIWGRKRRHRSPRKPDVDCSDEARAVTLADLAFRVRGRFVYETEPPTLSARRGQRESSSSVSP